MRLFLPFYFNALACINLKYDAMKLSHFHILFKKENECFLYNTKTLSLTKISERIFRLLKKVEENGMDLENMPNELTQFLRGNKLTDEKGDSDIEYRNKLEYRKRMGSFSGKTLSLVIAPTLACNFACPYCYEKDLPLNLMTEEVEDAIVDFINTFSETCDKIELCWEGGEPLIGFSRIKTLTEKIRNGSKIKINYQSIITNGFLITPDICDYFNSAEINFTQITIDGKPKTHNKSRILKNGQPTYDKIIENIDMLTEKAPECQILIRTNIHNGNKDEYAELHHILKERWKGHKVSIVPAFVQPNGNCGVECCNPRDKSDFMLDLKIRHDILCYELKPEIRSGHCSATKENSYIIDPEGNLYKCWNDIGIKECCVGNVFEGVKNNTLIARYIIGSDKYRDGKCTQCSLFPICDGGCNRLRMENQDKGTSYNLCQFDEQGISSYLYEEYKNRAKQYNS